MSTDDVSPALILRRHLFGNPERTALSLNPDGRWLSYLALRDGVLNLSIAPSREPSAAKSVTQDTERGIYHYLWAWTDAHLLYLQDSGGDENWHLFVAELSTLEVRDLTPVSGAKAVVIKQSQACP